MKIWTVFICQFALLPLILARIPKFAIFPSFKLKDGVSRQFVSYLRALFMEPKVSSLMETNELETEHPEGDCQSFHGKIVNGKCYRLIQSEATFEAAKANCNALGGKLWTPDFYEPDLQFILFKEFPELFETEDPRIWIGVQNIEGSLMTEASKDVSEAPWLNIGSTTTTGLAKNGQCLFFDHTNGALKPNIQDCATNLTASVCEFPLASKVAEFRNFEDRPDKYKAMYFKI